MLRPRRCSVRRIGATLAVLTLAVPGCHSQSQHTPPSAAASPSGFCSELGGHWDQAAAACESSTTSAKNITVKVTAKYPSELLDDPTAGPVLQGFVRKFFEGFARPDDSLTQDGSAKLAYQILTHSPATKSVVFTSDWDLGGVHPNDAIDTFTFDLVQRKQLALGDLFCPAIDPPVPNALYSFVQRYVQPPVEASWVQPGGPGIDYSSGYNAWALDQQDLVIYMPAGRIGAVHAAAFTARIPLSTMRSILRDGGCST